MLLGVDSRPRPMKSRTTTGMSLVVGSVDAGVSPHEKPRSVLQLEEQPSPFTKLPSSHSSSEKRWPSPQADLQLVPEQSGSSKQWKHPSKGTSTAPGLVSSHCSVPSLTPSPQTVLRHRPAASHTYPGSSWQRASQPSPSFVLPSSQVSLPRVTLSPQSTRHAAPTTGQK